MLIISHDGEAYNIDLKNLESLRIIDWDGQDFEVEAFLKSEAQDGKDIISLATFKTRKEAKEYIKDIAVILNG